jgi:hypothetical protein
MFFTNRTTGVSRVCQFLERVDAGVGEEVAGASCESSGRATFATLFFEPFRGRKLKCPTQ